MPVMLHQMPKNVNDFKPIRFTGGTSDKCSYNSYIGHMRTISAIDAKNRFGQLLDAAQREPVTVTKKGRPAAVMLSVEDYERIRGAARRRLLATIEQAQQEAAAAGMTEDVLDQLLNDES